LKKVLKDYTWAMDAGQQATPEDIYFKGSPQRLYTWPRMQASKLELFLYIPQ